MVFYAYTLPHTQTHTRTHTPNTKESPKAASKLFTKCLRSQHETLLVGFILRNYQHLKTEC